VHVPARAVDVAGLPGLLIRPRAARALLVLAHGAGAGMRHVFLEQLTDSLAAHGIATLRWEFPFMARKPRVGTRPRVDPPDIAEQAVRNVWKASARLSRLPRFAGGKSFGGRMTTRAHAALPLPDVHGIVLVGFPLHPAGAPAIARSGSAGPRSTAEWRCGVAMARAEHLAQTAGPLLFVQGSRDALAELSLLTPVVTALGARATLHVIDGADHSLSRRLDVRSAASTIATWIDMMLACGPATRPDTRRS
jgi:predicted alpha/beta-hydrolase family hydrolase